MMNKSLLAAVISLSVFATISSCKKDDDNSGPSVKKYDVPATYNFGNASYAKSTQRAKMAVELDAYLKKANTGSSVVTLDQRIINGMFDNTGNPFTETALNTTGVNLSEVTPDIAIYKAYADSVLIFNTGATAAPGVGGFVPRSANKIVVGPRGLEYGQAYTKGIMGALFFKEAVNNLLAVKSVAAADTVTAQAKWDAAFGYLAVPANYDTSVTYAATDPNRPLLWGGYLAERGKAISAGGVIFQAFLKGRAAIGGYDVTVRNAQADIILAKWEQLAAAAALNYVTSPTATANIGNYGSQLHALSEGFGFITSLKYRPAGSKLTTADFNTLNSIIHTDFYTLLNQPGFTDLVKAQTILKATYSL